MGKNWKLNNSLIQDPEIIKKIEQELEGFFSINDTSETPQNFVGITGLYKGNINGIGAGKKREKR